MNNNSMRGTYQELYSITDYGKHDKNMCPGARFIPRYKEFLQDPIVDLGCGTGDTVLELRKLGFTADGYDWVLLQNGMHVADITEPMSLKSYSTALCLDVLEHIEVDKLPAVLENLAQCSRAVVSVHIGSSKFCRRQELHLTQRPFKWWEERFSKHWKLYRLIPIETYRKLYWLERKRG